MTDFHGFKGRAKRLDDTDLPKIGHRIGVGEDELHAFMDVEAAGSGFDSSGRPKMLFEPHVFYRNLSGAKRNDAVKVGLAYAKWGTKPYPKDSYPRLVRAMAIDETAALKSASWGLTQVLGENYKVCGFTTPQKMVLAFMDDEENHLAACVAFLISAHIDDDLKAHRWAVVARVYNGPGYAKNSYDTKMAAAFAKWRQIKDTPWSPSQTDTAPAPQTAPDPLWPEPAQEQKPPTGGPTPTQTGIGALILAAIVGLATQFQAVWAWVWPWGLMGLAIIAVAGIAWWRRAHFTKGN